MTTPGPLAVIITCEHGGNRVPIRYRSLFRKARQQLASHEGFDAGALATAQLLVRRLGCPLVAATTTRLLIDLNRTERSSGRFSRLTRALPAAEQERIRCDHYAPHWARVIAEIDALLGRRDRVLHVASHSFTPVFQGRQRRGDVGLLYDPRREREAVVAKAWKQALERLDPELIVRRNYPYRGWTDGMATELRRRLPVSRYLGIELEVNQRLLRSPARFRRVQRSIAESLREVADAP